MNKKVIVYGNTVLSSMLFYDSLKADDFSIVAFAADAQYLRVKDIAAANQKEFMPPRELRKLLKLPERGGNK